MDELHLLQTVVAAVDIPDEGILAGDVGTIIDIYHQLALAFEVEFSFADGSPRTHVTLAPGQLRGLNQTDVLTVRQLSVTD